MLKLNIGGQKAPNRTSNYIMPTLILIINIELQWQILPVKTQLIFRVVLKGVIAIVAKLYGGLNICTHVQSSLKKVSTL